MNSNRILILGGAGFIGINLTLKLLGEGFCVSVINKGNQSVFENCIHKPDFYSIDILDFHLVEEIIKRGNFDTIIHLISNLNPGSTFEEFLNEADLNIKISCRLIDAAYSYGIQNFIYFSSGGTVYGNNGNEINKENDPKTPISLYGWYKNAIEQYIQTYTYTHPLNYLILRPSNPYGRFQDIYGKQGFIAVAIGKIMKGQTVEIWGDGFAIRDYIYIDDLTEIVFRLIKKGFNNNVFNLGTGEGESLNSIIETLKIVTAVDFETKYSEGRKADVKRNILDTSALYNFLSYNKKDNTSLDQGIGNMWKWANKQS